MTDGNTIFRQFRANESLCLDSTAVRIDATSSDPKASAGQARRDEKIFATWEDERYHFSALQFEADGGPYALTAKLIEVLPREVTAKPLMPRQMGLKD